MHVLVALGHIDSIVREFPMHSWSFALLLFVVCMLLQDIIVDVTTTSGLQLHQSTERAFSHQCVVSVEVVRD